MDPIKTRYNGNWFESLLEARWAVFFDLARIPYEYEYMGYKLGEFGKTWYLPDFYLPEQRCWVEVKPYTDFKAADVKKMSHFQRALSESGDDFVEDDEGNWHLRLFYIFVGSPFFNGSTHSYKVFHARNHNAPEYPSDMELIDSSNRWIHCPLCDRLSLGEDFRETRDVNSKILQEQVFCIYCSMEERRQGETKTHGDYTTWCDIDVYTTLPGYILGSSRLMRAYAAARKFKAPRK